MIKIHGHRGSRGTHPENTIPAFEEAVSAGADVFELDLQMTKDGIPVLSHEPLLDPALCRHRGGKELTAPIAIRTLTAKQVADFECGHRANPRFAEQKLVPGTAIPTLDDFLSWANKHAPEAMEFNIETKMTAPQPEWVADPLEFTNAVVAQLKKHGAIDRTILQSFDFRTLVHAKKIEPKLRLSCLFETEKDFCRRTKDVGAQFASPDYQLVTPEEVAACHQNGIQVVPWTANTPDIWMQMKSAGVDAIITDYPRRLRLFFRSIDGGK